MYQVKWVLAFLATVAQADLELIKGDANPFSHRDHNEETYKDPPRGLQVGSKELQCMLRTALNGLEYALRAWKEKRDSIMNGLGSSCGRWSKLKINKIKGCKTLVLFYADDVLVATYTNFMSTARKVLQDIVHVLRMKELWDFWERDGKGLDSKGVADQSVVLYWRGSTKIWDGSS